MVKKLLAFLLTFCMVVSMGIIPAFAMEPYEITYNIHSDNENNVIANTGDIIPVTFEMVRTDGDAATYFLNSYQNEIEYDMDFFKLDESSIQMTYPTESGINLAPTRTTGQQIIKATNTQVTHDKKHIVCTFNLEVIGTYGSGTVRTSNGKCSGWDDVASKSVKSTITNLDLTVTINPQSIVNVSGVTLSPATATLTSVGETLTLTPQITPSNASNKNVTYSSNNESVATVNDDGIVTAVANGTAVITVTTEDGNKTATCVVTVKKSGGGGGGSTGGGGSIGGGSIGGGGNVVDKTRLYTKDIFGTEHPTHTGYINGYPDGTVRPEGDITRDEMVAILYRIMNHEYEAPFTVTADVFPDVNTDCWAVKEIEYMADKNVVTGYPDGEFKPRRNLTRGEFAALIFRFTCVEKADIDNPYTDLKEDYWAYEEILALNKAGIMLGNDNKEFGAENNITRAEVMATVNRILGRKPLESYVKSLEYMPYHDLFKNKWYYVDVQEATITHDYYLDKNGYEYKWENMK